MISVDHLAARHSRAPIVALDLALAKAMSWSLLVGIVGIPNGIAQEAEEENLPLPELTFQHEEEEPSEEYLTAKPTGYLKLPKWEASERTAIDLGQPIILGGGLWPGQESLFPKIRANFQPTSSKPNGFRRPEDPRVVLPDVKRVSADAIPEAYLPYYFDAAPKRYLTDIQRLLTDSEWQDTDWFLTYHSNECRYHANVLLFSPEEQIPPSISGSDLLNRWYPDGDHVLVFYFHGRPDRTQVFFPTQLTSRFSQSEFQQNLVEAVDSASKAKSAGLQLDEFCQKLGTWLLWWEKRIKTLDPEENLPGENADSPLVGVVPASVPTSPEADAPPTGFGSVFWGVVGLIGLLLAGLVGWAISAAFKGKGPVTFPTPPPTSRLGAPHSGGGNVVLTFGSKN
ncbi:MAG: hypothetical protein O3C21_16270 [Verrucomicrobia bacterium]|nr:hypothetical protein [Verrucomicrobiota bacterium]